MSRYTKTSNMKYLFLIFTIFTLSLNAQEYTYSITQQDSTFTLDIITELSDQRQDIQRTTDLDSVSLQSQQYARIQQAYDEVAAAETRALSALRKINTLRASLNQVGLENYNEYQFERLDSTFATDNAFFIVAGTATPAWIQYREGLTQVIRQKSDNQVIATILPLSVSYIQINIAPAFQVDGISNVRLSSVNNRTYWGRAADGKTYLLRLLR